MQILDPHTAYKGFMKSQPQMKPSTQVIKTQQEKTQLTNEKSRTCAKDAYTTLTK